MMFDQYSEFIVEGLTLLWFIVIRFVLPLGIMFGVGWVLWRFLAPEAVPQTTRARREGFGAFVLRVRELPGMQLPELSSGQILAVFAAIMIWIAATGFLIARFFWGLQTATALSDAMPWGLWIAFKLSFVACAAGGFTFAAIVYVFRLEKYRPIVRTAILTGLIGYSVFIVSLLFDLGRWYNIWHPVVMWNPHSVMFEIAWCVMLYTAVLYAEFSPALFERLGWKRMQRIMHVITVPLVVAGVVLSTLHQSSLGSLYLIQFTKLHPLFWSPLIPVFFFTSAVATGLSLMMVVPSINARAFQCENRQELLATLARPAAIVLGVYLTLKVGDLLMRGQLPRLVMPGAMSALWWLEVLFGIMVPIALFFTPQAKTNPRVRYAASLLAISGVVLGRFNVALFGFTEYLGSLNVTYSPSFGEWVITFALIAGAVAAYVAAVKILPILPKPQATTAQAARAR
jgi:Ni/Fe-hydrogenase subunit HybB-like protein